MAWNRAGSLNGSRGKGIGEGAVAFAGLVDIEAGGVVENQLLIAGAGTHGVGEAFLIELGKKEQSVVGKKVVGIEINELLKKGVGIGIALLANADTGFLIKDLVEKGMREGAVGNVVKSIPSRVEEVAVEQEIGSSIAGKHVEGAVLLHVVADEEGEFHGIVGNELGGGGTENIELGFGPEEVVIVV